MANFGYDTALGVPAVVTATGVGTAVELDNRSTLRAQIVCTAVSGTSPSFTLTVKTSHDNGVTDAYRTVGSAFAAVTAAGSSAWTCFPGLDRWVQLSWVVSGSASPSLTLTVNSEAV